MTREQAEAKAMDLKLSERMRDSMRVLCFRDWDYVDGRTIQALHHRGLAKSNWTPLAGWHGKLTPAGQELAAGLAKKEDL